MHIRVSTARRQFTAVIANFLPPFFDRKSRGKPDNKFTAAYDNYGKRQTYGKFTAVNGKRQIHKYDEFTD